MNKNKELFLDCNAHTPISERALDTFVKYNQSLAGHGHPMAPNKPGREAACALETARGKIANLLGATRPGQIIFTSTCTQACEWAVKILESITPIYKSKPSTVKYHYVSPVEHPAIRDCTRDWQKLPIDENGVVQTTGPIHKAVCTHIQNEIGIIQPLEQIGSLYKLVDMCQSIGKVSINLQEMPIDIAVFGGHKFCGSASVGFIYLKNIEWWVEFGTGSRYAMDRCGTPDVAAIVATAEALEDELMSMPERLDKMREFQSELEPGLEELGCEIIAKDANRVPNTTFLKLPKPMAMEVLLGLSQEGIYVGLGSACGSMHTDSPLMAALKRKGSLSDFIRISQHGDYGRVEARLVIDKIKQQLRKQNE
jgi:cysteine desulfurase